MVVCWLVTIQHQLTSIQRETHADEQCVEDVWGNMQNPLVVHYHPVQRCAKKRAGGRVLFPCQQMLADNDEMVLTATRWGCQAQFHDNATCPGIVPVIVQQKIATADQPSAGTHGVLAGTPSQTMVSQQLEAAAAWIICVSSLVPHKLHSLKIL